MTKWCLVASLCFVFACELRLPSPGEDGITSHERLGRQGRAGTGTKAPRAGPRNHLRDPQVLVDGKMVATMAFEQLPSSLEVRWKTLVDGRKVRRYSFADYFEALGISLNEIEELTIIGGRNRPAKVLGDIAKDRDRFLFSFSRGDAGRVRCHWPSAAFTRNAVDRVAAIEIRLKKR